ncbi:DUF418 domain-containing protein [Larkinella ripae]
MESSVSVTAELHPAAPEPFPHSGMDRTGRIPTLNILRGLAVLGILLISILRFGLTEMQVGQLIAGPQGGNYWLLIIAHVLVEHKMRALFSLLFGAGLILFLTKAKKPGGLAVPELFLRRQLWLMAFGLVNALILLCPNDLLFQYGVAGILLFPLHRLSARALLVGALVTGLFFSGKSYWNYAEQQQKYQKYAKVVALEKKNKKVKLTDEQKADKSDWESVTKWRAYDAKTVQADITSMRSDYATVWNFLMEPLQSLQSYAFYRRGIWDVLSMMLLGMALLRWGFFTGGLTTGRLAILGVGGLVIGQTLAWAALPSYELQIGNFTELHRSGTLPWSELVQPFERGFSVVGWAGLVVWLYRLGVGAGLWRTLGAVGQLALTNYLMQTVFGTVFFYGYGLGYFGSLPVYKLYLVVAEIWLLQLVFSVVWLRYFHLGPAEWLWRSLTYGEKPPFRRSEPVAAASQTAVATT